MVTKKYNAIAVLVFLATIIVAHLLAIDEYDWKNNTVSELASQGYAQKWIMQMGFITFGIILVFGILNKIYNNTINYLIDIPIGIYGAAILISGIYCAKPFMTGIEFSNTESNIHSISASIAGIAFSIGILISGIKETEISTRIIHFIFFLFVIGMSAFFGLSPSHNGLIQKIMYLGSFYWLIYYYNYTY